MTGIEGEKSPNSNMAEKYPSNPSDPSESDSDGINQEIIKSLEELEPKLDPLEYIHDSFHDIPLICMREATDMELCFRLDPPSDVLAENGLTKDYHGMAEWSKLDPVFIKYLTKTDSKYKTTDVMAKWSTMETEPMPTLGNLQKCLCGEDGIERPDVITDLAKRINKDAFNWKMDKYRANTKKPVEKDYSWQLTRQDMIVGRRAYYTCCLVYADEDEGMASLITNLFKAVDKNAVFFNPQFDLKMGKYVHASTAQVIEERCGGKVIFIISEYFFASPVCQFTVGFAKGLDMAAEQGNLIPFRITEKTDHVPRVLLGIAGIRWFRRTSRKNAWCQLATAIIGSKYDEKQLDDLKQRVTSVVENNPEIYLAEAPYDSDTPAPGSPLSVYDPAPDSLNSDDPSSHMHMPHEDDSLVHESNVKTRSKVKRVKHYMRKYVVNRVLGRDRRSQRDSERIRQELDEFYSKHQITPVTNQPQIPDNTQKTDDTENTRDDAHTDRENERKNITCKSKGENGAFDNDVKTDQNG